MKSVLLGVIFLFLGCASNPQPDSRALSSIPDKVDLQVPHISQPDNYSCATTSLAMAISYYQGQEVDPHQAWVLSGSNAERVAKDGNDMKGLERLAVHFGFSGEFAENLSVEKLEYLLSKHILVVLNIKAYKTGNATHAALATGYDRTRGVIFVSDPANVLTEMTFDELNGRWSAHLSPPHGMSYRSGFILFPKAGT